MLTPNVIKTVGNSSFARGPIIDLFVTEEEAQRVYLNWQPAWPTPFEFPGNEKAVTVEQLLEVGLPELQRVFGKRFSKKLFDISNANNVM
jgi:hypothetical protein